MKKTTPNMAASATQNLQEPKNKYINKTSLECTKGQPLTKHYCHFTF